MAKAKQHMTLRHCAYALLGIAALSSGANAQQWPNMPPAQQQQQQQWPAPPAAGKQTQNAPAPAAAATAQPDAAAPEDQQKPVQKLLQRIMPQGGPAISGTWTGTVKQVGGNESKYAVVFTVDKVMETEYPELDCKGKLTRIGNSKSYVFFIEVMTKGGRDKGGRCADGTITVSRTGDKLVWGWFGNNDGDPIVVTGVLTKKGTAPVAAQTPAPPQEYPSR